MTKRCDRCGEPMTRPTDHNCGEVRISKDRLRTLEEIEKAWRETNGDVA